MGTVGDCIAIDYNKKKYEIEIVECKPAKAISIIEADVNVDFAPPKDYKEPTRPAAEPVGAQYAAKEEAEQAAETEPVDTGPKLRACSSGPGLMHWGAIEHYTH